MKELQAISIYFKFPEMQYNLEYTQSNTTAEADSLSVEGSLTVHHIDAIKLAIEEKLDKSSALVLKVHHVEQLDLSFLQLLLALKNNYQQRDQSLNIEMNLNPVLEKLLIDSGFENLLRENIK
jgi:anti-anti-sigma regulatory factor